MSLKCDVGGRDSVSFITVDEADEILERLPDDTTAWAALSTQEKEYRLLLAAQVIGTLPLRGIRAYRGQALAFPRTCHGFRRMIPIEVKEVQAMIAYSVIHRALANRPAVTEEATGIGAIKSVSLGGLISVSFGASAAGRSALDVMGQSVNFLIFLRLKRFLAQIRGGSILNADEAPVLSSTSTTSSSSTSSSTSSTSSTVSTSSSSTSSTTL